MWLAQIKLENCRLTELTTGMQIKDKVTEKRETGNLEIQ